MPAGRTSLDTLRLASPLMRGCLPPRCLCPDAAVMTAPRGRHQRYRQRLLSIKRQASVFAVLIASAALLQHRFPLVSASVPLTTKAQAQCIPFLPVNISTRQPLYSKCPVRPGAVLINPTIFQTSVDSVSFRVQQRHEVSRWACAIVLGPHAAFGLGGNGGRSDQFGARAITGGFAFAGAWAVPWAL